MQYTIENDVPPPVVHSSRGRSTQFPLRDLQPGQSFVAPQKEENAAMRAALNMNQSTEMQFATRKQQDGTRRIWRVK